MKEIFNDFQQFIKNLDEEFSERIAYKFLRDGKVENKTYHQLVGDMNGIANYLHKRNVERTTIALIGKTSYEWVATYFGTLKSNNIVVPVNPLLSKQEIENIMNLVNVKYVFLDDTCTEQRQYIKEHCGSVERVFSLREDFEKLTEDKQFIDIEVDNEEIAQYIFTSGTTGTSKAVMHSYRNILCSVAPSRTTTFKNYDVFLSVLPVHHCFEMSAGQITGLEYGCTICINDKIENIVENMRRFQPTITCVVPLVAEEMIRAIKKCVKECGLEFKQTDWSTAKKREYYKEALDKVTGGNLMRIYGGGAKIRPEVSEWFDWVGISLQQGYGMTELAGNGLVNLSGAERPDSVGVVPGDDLQMKIADDGELLFKGTNVMMGYYNMDNEPFFTKDGFLKTGDIATMDEDGYVYITGRKKNVIILKTGENVFPEEMEVYINVIPEVKNVMVFEWNQQIAAMIYPENQEDIAGIGEKIKKWNKTIPGYKRITKVFYRETPFPTTASGKIKRQVVIAEAGQGEAVKYAVPETETQKQLAELIKDILDIEKEIGMYDNFFSLGGSSLTALSLGAKANISPQLIYEYPVIGELAAVIDRKDSFVADEKEHVNDWITKNQNEDWEKPIKEVLLTGATGFLGIHVLHELLNQQNVHITCLIRSKEKFEKNYQLYFKEAAPESVDTVLGDMEEIEMGLDEQVYNVLKNKIDTVIHTAANVHHVGILEEFMKTNYHGTETMIKFCKDSGASLQYISSYAVSGFTVVPIVSDISTFDENTLYIGQEYKENVYVHTKYLSEKKILEERAGGLKANIYRVGCLTSRKSDGMFQLNKEENGFRNRVRGILKTGIYTEMMEQYPVDFTPVDECAKAIVKLALYQKVNNIYHLFNPNTIKLSDFNQMNNHKKLKKVSQEEFTKQTEEMLEDKEISEYVFYNSMALLSKPIEMKCEKTVGVLKKLSFEWPQPDEKYVLKFIGEVEENNKVKRWTKY